jgi:hypothetical protein
MRHLVPAAQRDRDAFDLHMKDAGCSCHTHPPCGFCTHPGNPANQEENETCWTFYTKDEALWWTINQMRRAARVMDIAAIMTRDKSYAEVYGKGLDMCADEVERLIDPEELRRMKAETYPDYCPTCGRGTDAVEGNETGGVDVCYDSWHEPRVEA